MCCLRSDEYICETACDSLQRLKLDGLLQQLAASQLQVHGRGRAQAGTLYLCPKPFTWFERVYP